MKTLVDAYYKIKSHKWDKNYEMFCGVDECEFRGNLIFVGLKFDHGS